MTSGGSAVARLSPSPPRLRRLDLVLRLFQERLHQLAVVGVVLDDQHPYWHNCSQSSRRPSVSPADDRPFRGAAQRTPSDDAGDK